MASKINKPHLSNNRIHQHSSAAKDKNAFKNKSNHKRNKLTPCKNLPTMPNSPKWFFGGRKRTVASDTDSRKGNGVRACADV